MKEAAVIILSAGLRLRALCLSGANARPHDPVPQWCQIFIGGSANADHTRVCQARRAPVPAKITKLPRARVRNTTLLRGLAIRRAPMPSVTLLQGRESSHERRYADLTADLRRLKSDASALLKPRRIIVDGMWHDFERNSQE